MNKLKTLKDCYMSDGRNFEQRVREESIKWYHRSDGNKHKFIMDFFNITKEDFI